MTDKEIFAQALKNPDEPAYCVDEVMRMLDLARADEREKLKDQIPPEGSGPWAIMQHWAGCVMHFAGESDDWDQSESQHMASYAFAAKSGWSVVSDEPKPMTFAEGDVVRIDSTNRKYIMRDGQWFPC